MSIKMYGIANCDTVKKARKFLDDKGVAFEFIDFKKNPPSEQHIQAWLKQFGSEHLINKRGTTWRKLSAQQQALAEGSPTQQARLLAENTSMIKRPIVEGKKSQLIGFDAKAFANIQ